MTTEETSSEHPETATVSVTPTVDAQPAAAAAIPPVGAVIGGKYRVEGVLGEGGMGVVLAATHVRLGRRVALKLLRPDVKTDRTALRLVREARSADRLRGPHVAEMIDVEMLPDGTPYLVLERLQGETLAERIARAGPLPLPEAADVLAQAAFGLAQAHAAGIVHRDVKPSNLFLTRDALSAGGAPGTAPLVKVLDFGIAKAAAPGDATLTAEATGLGSPAYASPEQTRGARDVDARTDVWALGVTLFEALSGERPFVGASPSAVAARIAADPPRSLAELRPGLPRAVIHLVESCLEKDPARRCPSATAFLSALAPFGSERAAALDRAAGSLAPALPPPGGARWLGAVAAAALVAVGAAAALRAAWRPPSTAPAVAASAEAMPSPRAAGGPLVEADARRVTFEEGCEAYPVWTPDSRTIVYNAAAGRDTHLFALDPDTGARREITHEPGWHMAPSVSPRGDQVAYVSVSAGEKATYLAAIDGSSRRLLAAGATEEPSWSPDGAFLWIGTGTSPEMQRIDVKSGAVTRKIGSPEGFVVTAVRELEDGRLLGSSCANDYRGAGGLLLYPPGASQGSWLWKADLESSLEMSPDGRAAIVARSTANGLAELWRVPLDGSPPERVPGNEIVATKGFHFSPDGRRAVWSTCHAIQELADVTPGREGAAPSLTPRIRSQEWLDDESNVIPGTSSVLLRSTRTGKLKPCVVDLSGHTPARCLEVGGLAAVDLAPSPDGKRFAFQVEAKGIFVAPLDDSAPPRRITTVGELELHRHPAFSPNGREIYFTSLRRGKGMFIEIVPEGGGTPRRFVDEQMNMIAFSPKGDVAIVELRDKAHKDRSIPAVLDLATRRHRPLSPELGAGHYERASFDARGERAALVQGDNVLVEVDVASGKVLRRLDAGNDLVSNPTYVDGELIVSRATWAGDLWVATAAR
jgi:serine/threonine-protein kinase